MCNGAKNAMANADRLKAHCIIGNWCLDLGVNG